MLRPMTSNVSALSSCVAKGHQALHFVSSAPSKIPYGGFSPRFHYVGVGWEEAEGEGGLTGRLLEEDGPAQVRRPLRPQRDQGRPQHRQIGVEVPVAGAGPVLGPQRIAHPVVADLTAAPVAPNGGGEILRRPRQPAAQVVGGGDHGWRRGGDGSLMHDHQSAHVGQVHVQRFQREDGDAPGVESSVVGSYTFAGKRGAAFAARACAWARAVG